MNPRLGFIVFWQKRLIEARISSVDFTHLQGLGFFVVSQNEGGDVGLKLCGGSVGTAF